MNNWVALKDGKPPQFVDVLVAWENSGNPAHRKLYVAHRDGEEWWAFDSEVLLFRVTHWMHLPEMPVQP